MNDSMDLPHTPLHSPTRILLDSPFSDYCTEPAVSPASSLCTSPHKALSHRLRQIWSQISSAELSSQTTTLLSTQLDALETTLTVPESQSRQPADIADSGLFVDDDDEEEETKVESAVASIEGNESSEGEGVVAESEQTDLSLKKAQAIASRVVNVAAELRARYEDVKHINDLTVSRFEAAANEVLYLRSENESLRSDIAFNHSELLFLKLQLKLFEAQTAPCTEQVDPAFLNGLERWKLDWIDVEQRFRSRRDRYIDEEADGKPNGDEDVWGECPPLSTNLPDNGHVEPIASPRKPDISQHELDTQAETLPPLASALGDVSGEVNESNNHSMPLDKFPSLREPSDVRHSRATSQSSHLNTGEDVSLDQQTAKGVRVCVKRIIIKKSQEKTPWQELWKGLYALAGMDRD